MDKLKVNSSNDSFSDRRSKQTSSPSSWIKNHVIAGNSKKKLVTKLTKGDRQRKEETAANREKKSCEKNREVSSKYLNAAVADFLFFISTSSLKLKVCELEKFLGGRHKAHFLTFDLKTKSL